MNKSEQPSVTYTSKDVEIISKQTVFSGFFEMVLYRFKHRLFDGGWSSEIQREMLVRGGAAALLPYDAHRDEVVLIEQIRVGALEHDSPWQTEIIAGIVDKQESVEELVQREAVEEAGVNVDRLTKVTSYYPSSGGCSEKIAVFVGQVDSSTASGVHGLKSEGEDIRVKVVPRTQAYQMIASGEIENGASIIALQWLELNYAQLQREWSL
ncbi:ADP-ribose diphosphatase [Vibrio sp. 10N.286.49.C2]|uniref:ADP-ribose diphosphatase n=1 Tax=unclassified Vibrio TaxID=2614977 RepID=UPI000C8542A7|nr:MULTISPECIES: ADP-ribose diphosphatase [unclassified Vibrio]PMH27484.1 ADP-ribose diphosphatase [Vibrio sp. 10N.286.49.C2]PMH52910.1 ADP-ribose diphosphatase [Vibrio sp. 10N.286.49.B1]PMH78393.1 ADP-ribose diphosphatase [Vibrio sp. 10N.286.48.B7]